MGMRRVWYQRVERQMIGSAPVFMRDGRRDNRMPAALSTSREAPERSLCPDHACLRGGVRNYFVIPGNPPVPGMICFPRAKSFLVKETTARL